MIRLVGVDLPRNKRIAYALTYIHGIGLTSAKKLVEMANINPETRISDLTTEETITLNDWMKSIVIEANVIEIIYLFGVKELEQMLVHDEDQKKPWQIRKNNFILIF